MLYIVRAEIQTDNVAYFQRKIQLTGFSTHPVGSTSKLIRRSGVLLYLRKKTKFTKGTAASHREKKNADNNFA
jgi:hypothetical protein